MPWTVHRGKYLLHTWPWPRLLRLLSELRSERFDVAVSARWDPRDDTVMWLSGARQRIGFPRMGSQAMETDPLERPEPTTHRHDRWRVIGTALGLEVPPLSRTVDPVQRRDGSVLVHSGAGKALRVWPLERFHGIVRRLRAAGHCVNVACDPDHVSWWREHGEPEVVAPIRLEQLMGLANKAGVFIGNDSGPGHVAGYLGIPTFTLFGPQVPEWFVPLHPEAEWIEGSPCPYRPCFDYCEFPDPFCLTGITEEQAWERIHVFVAKHLDVAQVR
jgi:heptosyltransferase-2